MSRKPRKKIVTGIYHVIVRGIGQVIFHEEDDSQGYLDITKVIARKRGKRSRVLLDTNHGFTEDGSGFTGFPIHIVRKA